MQTAGNLLYNFGVLPSEFLKKPKNEQRVDCAFVLAIHELNDETQKGGK